MSSIKRLLLFLGTSEAYKPILKAGYVLVAAALFALSQVGMEIIKLDLEAHKLKFEVEYLIKRPVESADCSSVGMHEPACRLAQHHLKTLSVSLRLWGKFIEGAGAVGTVLIFIGLFGWSLPLYASRQAAQA